MKIKSHHSATQQATRMACKPVLLSGIFLSAIFARAQVTVTGVTYGTVFVGLVAVLLGWRRYRPSPSLGNNTTDII